MHKKLVPYLWLVWIFFFYQAWGDSLEHVSAEAKPSTAPRPSVVKLKEHQEKKTSIPWDIAIMRRLRTLGWYVITGGCGLRIYELMTQGDYVREYHKRHEYSWGPCELRGSFDNYEQFQGQAAIEALFKHEEALKSAAQEVCLTPAITMIQEMQKSSPDLKIFIRDFSVLLHFGNLQYLKYEPQTPGTYYTVLQHQFPEGKVWGALHLSPSNIDWSKLTQVSMPDLKLSPELTKFSNTQDGMLLYSTSTKSKKSEESDKSDRVVAVLQNYTPPPILPTPMPYVAQLQMRESVLPSYDWVARRESPEHYSMAKTYGFIGFLSFIAAVWSGKQHKSNVSLQDVDQLLHQVKTKTQRQALYRTLAFFAMSNTVAGIGVGMCG
jgi:hypothetical protein